MTASIERQLDLFSVDRIGVEPVGRPVQPRRMAFELLDAELIAALPGADLATHQIDREVTRDKDWQLALGLERVA